MYRILLVYDESPAENFLPEKIDWKNLGFELAGVCQSGGEAVAFLLDHSPVQVLLTEIDMSCKDGTGLIGFLDENYPEIVILTFSETLNFSYVQKALHCNVFEYLQKPISKEKLSEALLRIRGKLDKRESQESWLEKLTGTYREYQKNSILIYSKTLSEYVQHSRSPEMSLEELEQMGITLERDCYRMAVLELDRYSDQYNLELDQRQDRSLMLFSLLNISAEMLENKDCGLAYQEGDQRINLLLWSDKPTEFVEDSEQICRSIQNEVRNAFDLTVSVALGRCVMKPEKLCYSWVSAQQTLDLFRGENEKNAMIDAEYLNNSKSKRLTVKALNYIEENYANSNFNLNEICNYLKVSTSYFSLIFKEETGRTFVEALRQTRMRKAMDLLSNTSLKNYEVAARVGFSDPHYFSIVFKKTTGMTPTAYSEKNSGKF